MELAERKCTTYKAGSPPLTRKETMELLGQVPGWTLNGGSLQLRASDAEFTTMITSAVLPTTVTDFTVATGSAPAAPVSRCEAPNMARTSHARITFLTT